MISMPNQNDGNRQAADGDDADDVVHPGAAHERGRRPQWYREQHREYGRHDRDLQRQLEPKRDFLGHRPLGPHRDAEVERREAVHVVGELVDQRLVEAEPLALRVDHFLRDVAAVAAQLHLHDVARNHAQHERRRGNRSASDHQEQAVQRVAEHEVTSVGRGPALSRKAGEGSDVTGSARDVLELSAEIVARRHLFASPSAPCGSARCGATTGSAADRLVRTRASRRRG